MYTAGSVSHGSSGLYFHVVLATRALEPLIGEEMAQRLQSHVTHAIRALDGDVIATGSMPDHLHLLVHIGPSIGLSKLITSIKGDSTRWAFITFPYCKPLEWDDGYVAFTVCGRDTAHVSAIIKEQRERHQRLSYREEVHRLARNRI